MKAIAFRMISRDLSSSFWLSNPPLLSDDAISRETI